MKNSTHRPTPHIIRILTTPTDNNSMTIKITQEHLNQDVCLPRIFERAGPETQSEDAGQGPEELQQGDVGGEVEAFGESGYRQEGEDVGCGVGDGEEVGVVGAEAEVSEGKG